MFFARLAGEHLHVDEAGQQRQSAAIDRLHACRHVDGFADSGDFAVDDKQRAGVVQPGGRVNEAGIEEGAVHDRPPPLFGRLAASASSTAMRTATPIST